jgi:hypothetical protein
LLGNVAHGELRGARWLQKEHIILVVKEVELLRLVCRETSLNQKDRIIGWMRHCFALIKGKFIFGLPPREDFRLGDTALVEASSVALLTKQVKAAYCDGALLRKLLCKEHNLRAFYVIVFFEVKLSF